MMSNYFIKKNSFKGFCLTAVMILLFGCSEGVKEITVKGADGREYTSYRTACSNGDFDAAREYIEKMKVQLTEAKAKDNYDLSSALRESIREAEDYVYNEEIQFLASLNEVQANNRLILILNMDAIEGFEAREGICLGKKVRKKYLDEYPNWLPDEVESFRLYKSWCGKHNSKCDKLLNIAISCGNENLAKKLIHQYKNDPELELKNEKKEEKDYYYYVYAHYTSASLDAAKKNI